MLHLLNYLILFLKLKKNLNPIIELVFFFQIAGLTRFLSKTKNVNKNGNFFSVLSKPFLFVNL